MKLYLDTANLDAIRETVAYYPIVGVTTNPTILSREGGDPVATLKAIRAIIGEDRQLHVQLTETVPERMIEEAKAIVALLGKNTYIKVPVGEVGLKVTAALAALGIGVTETAIFTAGQALLAARAGASYVAPYVNRLDNILADGVGVVSDIAQIFAVHGIDTEVLAASFKSSEQVIRVALAGGHTATLPPDVLKNLLGHPLTTAAVDNFAADWSRTFGGATLREMLTT